MIIAIDVDDTVANLVDAWINRYNFDFKDNLKKKDILEWNISKFVKPECGVKIYDYLRDKNLYNYVSPVKDSLEGVSLLKRFGRVIFITAPTLETMGAKYHWLREHGYIDSLNDYIETKEKHLIKYDYIIDDNYENVKDSNNNWLYTRPWNKQYNYPQRISNWRTFINKKMGELWQG